MANLDTSTVSSVLAYTYNRENYLAPHERFMTKFWNKVQKFTDPGGAIGARRNFEVVTADSHATAGTGEGTDFPTFVAPTGIQCYINAIQLTASLQFSDMLLSVGKADGLATKMEVINRYVKMTVRNFYSMLNRHTLGHATGRMAVVQDTTDTLTTFVCRNPESVYQLRVNMNIDFFDTDTGGTKQGASQLITAINFETRTVTIDAARTLTTGWSVFKAKSSTVSEYGIATNGLRGCADNASLQATYCGQARSSNPALNATVLTASGGTQSYSEKLVRKAINRIRFQTDLDPDEIWCNEGIVSEHLNHLTGSRIFTISGDGVPSYQIGQQEAKLGFMTGGKLIPFKVDRDLPNREFIVITESLFRKHIARQPNWAGEGTNADGSEAPFFFRLPGTGTYATAQFAGMMGILNLAHLQPKALSRVTGVSDEELAGDITATI